MRGVRVLTWALLCGLATSCSDNRSPSPSQEPGSPEVIEELANQERSVEDFDVCEAVRNAGAEDDLADILDAESVSLESNFSQTEDALTQSCEVTTNHNQGGEAELWVLLFQGSEFKGAEVDDPVVYPGCRVAQKPPPARLASGAAVRATCRPYLTVDVDPDLLTVRALPPWTEGSDSKPTEEYVNLLHDVLVAVSAQG